MTEPTYAERLAARRRTSRRRWIVAVAATVVLLGAAGVAYALSSGSKPVAPPGPARIACAALWTAGTVIPANLPDVGCLDPRGKVTNYGLSDCRDGGVLYGDDRFWGYAGQVTHVGLPDADPGYKTAFAACNE